MEREARQKFRKVVPKKNVGNTSQTEPARGGRAAEGRSVGRSRAGGLPIGASRRMLSRIGADIMLLLLKANVPNSALLAANTDVELARVAAQHGVMLPAHLVACLPPEPPPEPEPEPPQLDSDDYWGGALSLAPPTGGGGTTAAIAPGTAESAAAAANLASTRRQRPKRVKGKRRKDGNAQSHDDGAGEEFSKSHPGRVLGRQNGNQKRAPANEVEVPDDATLSTRAAKSGRARGRPRRLWAEPREEGGDDDLDDDEAALRVTRPRRQNERQQAR